ncbi:hypothetical protein [Sporichthya polymorpha]|uniref:hypothetical protein n=1 Tax=Sporichthya polymorpha TaxID=35751 RepID=UPI000374384C|nr:hypothetical protein [Sporichthya polymorpha]
MHALVRRAGAASAVLALALSPTAAHAAGPKPVTQGDGILIADGAAVRLPATFVCPAGWTAYLAAQVVQAVGDEFAGGFDSVAKDCTGQRQKVTFFVQAVPAGDNTHPFRPGAASSRVIMDAVDPAAEQPPYYEGDEVPVEEEGSPLLPLPPLMTTQDTVADDPMPTEPAPQTVHAEARGVIKLKEKARS